MPRQTKNHAVWSDLDKSITDLYSLLDDIEKRFRGVTYGGASTTIANLTVTGTLTVDALNGFLEAAAGVIGQANIATSRILGRGTAGAGNVEELTLASTAGLTMAYAAGTLDIGAITDTPQFAQIGLGAAPLVGTLAHLYSGASLGVPLGGATDMVIESNGNAGFSMLLGAGGVGTMAFVDDDDSGSIYWQNDLFYIDPAGGGAVVQISASDFIINNGGVGIYNTSVYSNVSLSLYIDGATGNISLNQTGANSDLQYSGDTLSHMIFCDASALTENIALLAGAAPNWQTMDGGIYLGDCSTVPVGNPANGGFLYASAGALVWRGSGGTITTLAPA